MIKCPRLLNHFSAVDLGRETLFGAEVSLVIGVKEASVFAEMPDDPVTFDHWVGLRWRTAL
jgi:hypothetical protein